MKKLILLRHAKSSWDDPRQDDHDRALNARGRRAAPVMARWLAAQGYLPDMVLCSSATRARETYDRMRAEVSELPEARIDSGLYLAAPDRMLDHLTRLPATCATAMLIAHQPGLGAFAVGLADGSEDEACRRARTKFPTAGAAALEFDAEDWSALRPGAARFTAFTTPRDLDG